jgi:hypothetical protein
MEVRCISRRARTPAGTIRTATTCVLYVADRPETAFAETFGHALMENLPPVADKFVTLVELQERHLYRIRSDRGLTLALFHGPGLPALNLDAQGWGLV